MQATPATTSTRLVEIDFFRGLVLLFILVDHISGTVLGRLTLCNYSIADASEIFVFLAGLVTAMAYERIAQKKSPEAAAGRFYRRATEIYVAYLLTALLMLVCGMCLYLLELETPALEFTEVLAFFESPLSFLGEVVMLRRQPYFSDILPMYGIFALAAPWLIRAARRSMVLLLSASVLLWLCAPWLAPALLPNVEGGHWTFNPFAWQLVYMIGLVVGCEPSVFSRWPAARRRWLTVGAAIYAVCGAAFVVLRAHPEWRHYVIPSWTADRVFRISKEHASSWRVASFLATAWLVYSMCSVGRGWRAMQRIANRATVVTTIGRNSLDCFIATAVISILTEGLTYAIAGTVPEWYLSLAGDVLAVALLCGAALFFDARTRAKPAPAQVLDADSAVPARTA